MAQANLTKILTIEKQMSSSFPDTLFDDLVTGTHLLVGNTLSLSGVTKVKSNCFISDVNLSGVNFPNCSYVYNSAFQYCSNLSFVSLPICTCISSSAFRYCKNLNSIYLPACKYIGQYAFCYCSTSLYLITLQACTAIHSSAFYGASKLSQITLGASSICTLASSNAFSYTSI